VEGSFTGDGGDASYETGWDHNFQLARHVENGDEISGSGVLPADIYKVTVTDYAIDRAGNWSKPVNLRLSSFRVNGIIDLNADPDAGGDTVTIIGSGFTGATAVTFGGTAATSIEVLSDTTIQATSPAGTGTVDVTVTTSKGTNWSAGQYTYAPAVTGLSPTTGPPAGGNTVTITGSGFTGATAVTFGGWVGSYPSGYVIGTPATSFQVLSDSTILATAPAGTGTVEVFVTTPAGTSASLSADHYTYIPDVTRLTPTTGPCTGGTSVTIRGIGFTGATAVTFGGTAATSFEVLSDTTIQATSPANWWEALSVDVTVTTPEGTSAPVSADVYNYY
jgi:hypothetical protein